MRIRPNRGLIRHKYECCFKRAIKPLPHYREYERLLCRVGSNLLINLLSSKAYFLTGNSGYHMGLVKRFHKKGISIASNVYTAYKKFPKVTSHKLKELKSSFCTDFQLLGRF